MPSSTHPPSYRIAAGVLPYALPFSFGLACLGWSGVELVSVFTQAYWVFVELLPALVVLCLGSGLVFFSTIGAIAYTLRSQNSDGSKSPAR